MLLDHQGDQEVAAGIDMSPFMDRHNAQPVKCQTGFINFIVAPLYASWEVVVPSLKSEFRANLETNQAWLKTGDCFADMPFDALPGRYSSANAGGSAGDTMPGLAVLPSSHKLPGSV